MKCTVRIESGHKRLRWLVLCSCCFGDGWKCAFQQTAKRTKASKEGEKRPAAVGQSCPRVGCELGDVLVDTLVGSYRYFCQLGLGLALLAELHWLPVRTRLHCKILLITYNITVMRLSTFQTFVR